MTISTEHTQSFADLPHILVVDDDVRILELVSRYLSEHDFIAMTAGSAAQAREMLARFAFDALVVDVMMPGETGLEFTASLRAEQTTPVLLLTALGEADDRIAGLEAGADDYLAKPFEPRELLLRLQAILKRTKKTQETVRDFKIGSWVFDVDLNELRDGEEVLHLTDAEVNLIKALASKVGEVISRDELATLCGVDAGERTIDVQVTRLRRKIEADTKVPRYLQTVRGKGYLLRIEEL